MIVYRLSKSAYARDLTGKGAEMSGGRWNSKGTAIVYTSQSRALCMAEIAVHTPLGNLPIDYCLVTIALPDHSIHVLNAKVLSDNWRSFPHLDETQKIGDKFITEEKYLVLQVPSAVVQGDFNFLLNPRHKKISEVKIIDVESFDFDERLFIK